MEAGEGPESTPDSDSYPPIKKKKSRDPNNQNEEVELSLQTASSSNYNNNTKKSNMSQNNNNNSGKDPSRFETMSKLIMGPWLAQQQELGQSSSNFSSQSSVDVAVLVSPSSTPVHAHISHHSSDTESFQREHREEPHGLSPSKLPSL